MLMQLILEKYQEKLQNSKLHQVLCGAIWHMWTEKQLVGVMRTIGQIFQSILAADLIFIQIFQIVKSQWFVLRSLPIFEDKVSQQLS